jgi:hypothetical protein
MIAYFCTIVVGQVEIDKKLKKLGKRDRGNEFR